MQKRSLFTPSVRLGIHCTRLVPRLCHETHEARNFNAADGGTLHLWPCSVLLTAAEDGLQLEFQRFDDFRHPTDCSGSSSHFLSSPLNFCRSLRYLCGCEPNIKLGRGRHRYIGTLIGGLNALPFCSIRFLTLRIARPCSLTVPQRINQLPTSNEFRLSSCGETVPLLLERIHLVQYISFYRALPELRPARGMSLICVFESQRL